MRLIVVGSKHGHGKLYKPKGAWYEGNFVNGARIGVGRYHWPSGCEYYGDFVGKRKRKYNTDSLQMMAYTKDRAALLGLMAITMKEVGQETVVLEKVWQQVPLLILQES